MPWSFWEKVHGMAGGLTQEPGALILLFDIHLEISCLNDFPGWTGACD